MNKAQANAMMGALEARKMNADAVMRFDAAGNETWNIQLDTSQPYQGADISALANYCAQNGLTLTAQFSALGVV